MGAMNQPTEVVQVPKAGTGFDWSTLDWDELLADSVPIPPGPESG